MRPIALDTRRLVSSEFPQCNTVHVCRPAKPWVWPGGADALTRSKVKRGLHFRYADALLVVDAPEAQSFVAPLWDHPCTDYDLTPGSIFLSRFSGVTGV